MDDTSGPLRTALGDVALAGASEVGARITEDEQRARAERERLSREGLAEIPAEAAIAGLLRVGEFLIDVREACQGERIAASGAGSLAGRLYVTNERLLIAGGRGLEIDLSDVAELDLIGERLLIRLTDGTGVGLSVPAPRVLRARMAFALRRLRG